GLDVWRFDAHWRGELASLVFEIGGGFNQPGRNRGVGGGPCHFEQRRCCLASVVAVLGHGTGSPIFWRMNAQPKISVPQRKYKTERTEAVPLGCACSGSLACFIGRPPSQHVHHAPEAHRSRFVPSLRGGITGEQR